MLVSNFIEIAINYLCSVVHSLNNISVEHKFDQKFSIETRICLIIFGRWLDSVCMYCIWSSGLWYSLKVPSFKVKVSSRKFTISWLLSAIISQSYSLGNVCNFFFIFSNWIPLLFLNIDKQSSQYNPTLLLLQSLHTSATSRPHCYIKLIPPFFIVKKGS